MKRQFSVLIKILFLGFLIIAFLPSAKASATQDSVKVNPYDTNKDNTIQSDSSSIHNPKIKYFINYTAWDRKENKFVINKIKTSSHIKLGSELTICMAGLHKWIQAGNDPNSLRIFLSGYMLPNIEPVLISPGPQENVDIRSNSLHIFLSVHRFPTLEPISRIQSSQEYVKFLLKFNESDKEERAVWANILASARSSKDLKISISLGQQEKRQAFESNVYVTFQLYPKFWPLIAVLPFALLFVFFRCFWKTKLFRDTSSGENQTGALPPFSLSRVQMAWWFYLVLAAFIYIWLVTQTPPTLTPSVLGLLGISATTGLMAVVVDTKKIFDKNNKRKELEIEINSLNNKIQGIEAFLIKIESIQKDPKSQVSKALTKSIQKDLGFQLSKALTDFKRLPPVKTPSKAYIFITELLDGGDGICLHRLQIVVWTFFLGVIFLYAVYKNFSMPEFDASLLALMGISSGTYIGFKFPEKK